MMPAVRSVMARIAGVVLLRVVALQMVVPQGVPRMALLHMRVMLVSRKRLRVLNLRLRVSVPALRGGGGGGEGGFVRTMPRVMSSVPTPKRRGGVRQNPRAAVSPAHVSSRVVVL
jgi:hypothetical protein